MAERRARVAKLYTSNMPLYQIAVELGVDREVITDDLKALRAEWREARLTNMDEAIAEQLAKLDHAEREAWVEWERSKKNAKARIKTTETAMGIATTKVRKEVRGQCGDPRYEDIILKCITKRCELLGLDAPKKSEMDVNVHKPPLTRAELMAVIANIRERTQSK